MNNGLNTGVAAYERARILRAPRGRQTPKQSRVQRRRVEGRTNVLVSQGMRGEGRAGCTQARTKEQPVGTGTVVFARVQVVVPG